MNRIYFSQLLTILAAILLISVVFSSCGTHPAKENPTSQEEASPQKRESSPQISGDLLPIQKIIPATDSGNPNTILSVRHEQRIRWEGIVDFSAFEWPRFTWSGGSAILNFKGSELLIHFGSGSGQTWFNLVLDDEVFIFKAMSQGVYTITIPLENTEHHMVLFKRSEAEAGSIALNGFSFPEGELLEPGPVPERSLLFFGDSITTGSCNEDAGADQWADRSTHNFYMSYAAITSRELNTSLYAFVQSGMGVSTGYFRYTADQLINRLDSDPGSPPAIPVFPAPDACIINLGENDYSYPRSIKEPFPADFTEKYISLVEQIRREYPQTKIICTLGGMYGSRFSKELRSAWQEAVDVLTNKDPQIASFRFSAYSRSHPRVSTHQEMAGELSDYLKMELGW